MVVDRPGDCRQCARRLRAGILFCNSEEDIGFWDPNEALYAAKEVLAQAEANGELLVVLGDENGKDCWPEDTKTPRQERITDREPLRARRDSNPQPSDP